MELNQAGYKFHKQIFKTYTRHPKYYCIATTNILRDLKRIRKNRTIIIRNVDM